MATFATVIDQVESLYVGYFGRAGDPSGTQSWTQAVSTGKVTISSVAALFATSPEAQGKYPYLAAPQVADPTQFVGQVYQNLFNRIPDQAGLTFWVNYLDQNKGNPTAVGTFISTVIASAQGVDGATITNKVIVATDFTQKVTDAGTTFGAQTSAQSTTEIQAVNDTAASVTAAKAATTAYIAQAPGPEQTFTMTIGETKTSADTNANFKAPLEVVPGFNMPQQTLQSGDSALATGAGATLTATLQGGGNQVTNVTISGIPTVNLTDTNGGGSGVSGNITGVTTLNLNNSVGNTTVGAGFAGGGLNTALKTVAFSNSGGAGLTATVAAAALAGASDALTLNFKTATGTNAAPALAAVNVDTGVAGKATNAYETITVKADATTFVRLSDGTNGILSTTQIDVTGAGKASLFAGANENFKNVTTIDATASGGATITGATTLVGGLLTGNTALTSFKGGTGADSLDISNLTAAQLQAFTAGKLDGGTGTDTLIVGSAAATALTANVNQSGFEALSISKLSGSVDFGKFGSGIESVSLVDTVPQFGNATFNNVTSGVTFALSDKHGGFTETFNSVGTGLTDSVNITLKAGVNVNTITTAGFETVTETLATGGATVFNAINATASPGANVTYNFVDNSAGLVTINALNIGVGGTFNIGGTGAGGITLNGVVTAGAINASTAASGLNMTGSSAGPISILGSAQDDTLRGGNFGDSIGGGGGVDIIAPGLGADTVGGGSGADTFTSTVGGSNFAGPGQGVVSTATSLGNTILPGQTITFGNGVDRVTDFVSGTDKADVMMAGVAPTNFINANANAGIAANSTVVLYGSYDSATRVFTAASSFVAGASTDAIVAVGNGAGTMTLNNHDGIVVLTGLNQALQAGDFV